MKYKVQEFKIIAATDDAGSHVMVVGPDTHLMSRQQANHRAAEDLARRIAVFGIDSYDMWRKPYDSLFELCSIMSR